MRFYYAATYLDLSTESPMISDEAFNTLAHIPYSNRIVNVNTGYARKMSVPIAFETEADFLAFTAILPTIIRISLDAGVKWYEAVYDGGQWEQMCWGGMFTPTTFSFSLGAEQFAETLRSKAGNAACPNTGNTGAQATFVITVGTEIAAGLTISDGVRTLVLTGLYHVNDVLTITNWKALDNADEVTLNISGDFPLVPAGATTFTFTFTGITAPATEVSITYRDTWR